MSPSPSPSPLLPPLSDSIGENISWVRLNQKHTGADHPEAARRQERSGRGGGTERAGTRAHRSGSAPGPPADRAQPPAPAPRPPGPGIPPGAASPPLGPGGPCADGAPALPAEAEETVSVSSCLASEDTTEDSGVMSSPSDIVSLDSQHGSTKSPDKWATDPEDGSDQDLGVPPEPGPPRSPAWEGDGPGHWPSRAERAEAAPEAFAGQWERTLASLDEDLEGMDDSYETDSSSVTGSLGSASGRCLQDALPAGAADAIPVTFIGEVLDDPADPGPFSNRNNNAGSFDRGSVAGRWACPPPAPAAPRDVGKEVRAASSDPRKEVSPVRAEPRAAQEPPGQDRGAQEPRPGPGRDAEDRRGVRAPPSWFQRGQHPGGSFGLKHGLTTYKIVPPRPDQRCYDRGVSLSTGAIAIDELGNLVAPPGGRGRPAAVAAQKDTQPPGHGRALPGPGSPSTEELPGRPPATPATATATATAQHPAGGLRAEPGPPAPAGTSPQQPAAGQGQGEGPCPQPGARPAPPAAAGPTKVPAASAPHALFLKPQRRTSSQYVASAIAKRMAPPRAQASALGRPGGARKPWEDGLPCARRDAAAPGPRPGPHACTEETEAHGGGAEPAEPAAGAPPRGLGISPPGGPSTQDGAAGAPRGPTVPLASAARRARGPVGPGRGSGGNQSPGDRNTSPARDRSGPPDGSRWAPGHSEPPAPPRAELEGRPGVLCTEIRGDDPPSPSIFGPKKRFRPVVQRPAPKDTSLHSALMEAIHAAGGRDRLRKTPEPRPEGGPKKPSYVEAESEHSALLAAIRGHRGACSLRKVASCAAQELRSFREAARSEPEPPGPGAPSSQPAPAPAPAPPAAPAAPPATRPATRAGASALGSPADARQALMDAIRSGTGAARLRKVPLLV